MRFTARGISAPGSSGQCVVGIRTPAGLPETPARLGPGSCVPTYRKTARLPRVQESRKAGCVDEQRVSAHSGVNAGDLTQGNCPSQGWVGCPFVGRGVVLAAESDWVFKEGRVWGGAAALLSGCLQEVLGSPA